MRNLADKAFELSKKHNLKDEVRLIEEEERKLEKYLQQEQARQQMLASPEKFGLSPPDVKALQMASQQM